MVESAEIFRPWAGISCRSKARKSIAHFDAVVIACVSFCARVAAMDRANPRLTVALIIAITELAIIARVAIERLDTDEGDTSLSGADVSIIKTVGILDTLA